MPQRHLLLAVLVHVVLVIFVAAPVFAATPTTPASVRSMAQLTRQSGYIFTGTVVSAGRDHGAVRVTFAVEQAIRGVRAGETLSIREWAGLWGRQPHYHIGQRLMLFLYPQSKLGLTSPVSGDVGQVKVLPGDTVIVRPEWDLGLAQSHMRLGDLERIVRQEATKQEPSHPPAPRRVVALRGRAQ